MTLELEERLVKQSVQKNLTVFLCALISAYALFCSPLANAQSGPRLINISGGLFQPNGNAILNNNVTFKIEIRDKAGSCVLYSEIHSGQDLSQTKGAFSLLLGAGSSPQNFLSGSAALDAVVFKNPGVIPPFTGCASGVTFAAGDERVIRVYYDTGSGLTAMTPDVPVVASAYAMVAETLQGKNADEFAQLQGTAAGNLNQANLEYSYSLTNWQRLKDLIDGVSSQYLPTAGTGTFDFGSRRITGVSSPGTSALDAINKGYADAYIGGKGTDLTSVGAGFGGGQTLVWDQAQNKWVTGSAADATKLPLAGGTMSGDITMAGNDLFSVGDIIMNTTKRFQMGRYTAAEETALVATLGTGSSGTTWFNTTTGMLMVWNGTSASTAGMGGSAGGDLTGSYPNPSIAAGAVATAKIADNAITAAKIKTTGVAINRLIATDPVTPNNLTYFECSTVNQIIAWTASGWACTTVSSLAPVKTVAGRTPDAAGNVALTAYDITGIESAATKDYGTAPGELVELDGTGRIPASMLPASTGTITSVVATSPLQGGGTSGAVTVSIDVGTGANQVVRLNGSAQIPAVDGSLLTNVTAVNAQRIGGYPVSTSAPGSNQILTWNGSAWEAASASASLSWPLAANPGTASASGPSYSFLGDTNTGMYTSGADTLNFATGGTDRLTVSSNGNVGVGTTSPAALLDISGTGTNSALIVPRDTTANRPSGNVANGMVRYNTNLNVFEFYQGGAWTSYTTGAGAGGDFYKDGSVAMTGAFRAAAGNATTPSISFSSDPNTGFYSAATNTMGFITNSVERYRFGGSAIASQTNNGAHVNMAAGSVSNPTFTFVNDTDTGIYSPGAGSAAVATNGTARMTISDTGMVGIGTTSPAAVLEVQGSGNLVAVGSASNTLLMTGTVTNFVRYGTNAATMMTVQSGDNAAGRGVLRVASASGTKELIWADAAGNVAIGGTSPLSVLDIAATGTNSALIVPRDTTANRPSGNVANGMVRYNTNLNVFEFYQGGAWTSYTTGSGSGGDFYKDGSVAMTGAFHAAAGNATTPSISFSSDPNTGFYSVATNSVGFITNSVERYRFGASGMISLFTGGPSIKTNGVSASFPSYAFENDDDTGMYRAGVDTLALSTAGTARLTLDRTGLVGVGVTAPVAALDVAATGTNSAIVVPRDTTANRPAGNVVNGMVRYNTNLNKFEFYENGSWLSYASSTAGVSFPLLASPIGSVGAPAYSFSGDSDTGFYSSGAGTAALAINGTSRFTVDQTGAKLDSNSLTFRNVAVAESSDSLAASGFAAVTIAPTSGNKDAVFRVVPSGSSLKSALEIFGDSNNGTSNYTSLIATDTNFSIGNVARSVPVRFLQSNVEVMRLDAAGKLGVGVTAPVVALDVAATGTTSAILVPRDTTANRPAGNVANGMIRYNTNTNAFEFYQGGGWTTYTTGSGSGGDFYKDGSVAMTGAFLAANGTATAPSISFSGDNNTGFYLQGANIVGFASNSQYRFRMGNSGIMSATNNGPFVSMGGVSASSPSFTFESDSDTGMYRAGSHSLGFSTYGTARMTIASNGNVGIGTTSPTAAFQVVGGTKSVSANFSMTTDALLQVVSNATTNWSRFGTNGSPAAFITNGADTGTSPGAAMIIGNTNTVGLGGNILSSSTFAGATLVATNSGAVGIGNATPAAALDVAATGTSSAILVPRDTTANRPSGNVANGMIRYNTNTNKFEFYENATWVNYGTGSGSGTSLVVAPSTGSLIGGTTNASTVTTSNLYNTVYGYQALNALTTGASNVAVGPESLKQNTTGSDNTAIGRYALGANTTNNNNTAVGASALSNIYAGGDNVAVGAAALASGTSADGVVAIGYNAIRVGRGGNDNIAVGKSALYNVSGNSNIVVGANAGTNLTSGGGNTVVGSGSANTLTTGSNNVLLSSGFYPAETPANNTNNFLNIGNLIFATNMSGSLSAPAGNVGIGSYASADAVLALSGTTSSNSSLLIPRSTTATRPATAVNGMIRYNTNTNKFEFYENAQWVNYGTGASGGSVSFPLAASPIGSAGAPAYSFSGDMNTGIYSSGADHVNVATAGTARLTVDELGNVGIGTTSPFTPLDIVSPGSTTWAESIRALAPNLVSGASMEMTFGKAESLNDRAYMAFEYNGAANTSNRVHFGFYGNSNLLTLQASGKLGVGTSSPAGALDVATTGTNSAIVVPRDTTANRPAGNVVNGMIRYNTNTNKFEFYENAGWVNIVGSGGSGSVTESATNNTIAGVTNARSTTNANVTAFGYQALHSLTTGGDNTAFGSQAGRGVTTGNYNTTLGTSAGYSLGAGSANTLVGNSSGSFMTGSWNTAVGSNTMSGTTGNSNAAFGFKALTALTSGAGNTGLGNAAGSSITTGSGNVMIGSSTNPPNATDSNKLNIGNSIFGSLSQTTPSIGIGIETPVSSLHVRSAASVGTELTISTAGTGSSQQAWMTLMTKESGSNRLGVAGTKGWTVFGNGDALSGGFGGANAFGIGYYDGANWLQPAMTALPDGRVGMGTSSPSVALEVNGTTSTTSAILVPRATTAARPTAQNGMIRYNTNTNKFEFYENAAWVNYGTGSSSSSVSFPLLASPIGTTATPAYSFSGDADTGMYNAGPDRLAFATGGTARFTFEPNGNMIMGSPSQSGRFAIKQLGTADSNGIVLEESAGSGTGRVYLDSSATFIMQKGTGQSSVGLGTGSILLSTLGTTRMTLNNSGYVGVGTTSPQDYVHIISNQDDGGVMVEGNGNDSANMNFRKSRGTFASKTAVQTGDEVWNILGYAYSGGGYNYSSGIIASVDDTVLAGTAPGAMDFYTRSKDGAWSSRMKIAASGQVGIGTIYPTTGALLDLYGTGQAQSTLLIPRDTTANRPSSATPGMIRYNTTNNKFEGYENGAWVNLVSSGGGDFKSDGTVAMSAGIKAAPGTVGAPGYSFSGDTDTGIYRSGSNQMEVATGGTSRLTIGDINTVFNDNDVYINKSTGYGYIANDGTNNQPAINSLKLSSNVSSTNTGFQTVYGATNSSGTQQRAWMGAVSVASGYTPVIVIGQQTGASAYAERARFEANGNFVLGATTAGSAALAIEGTTASNSAILIPRATTATRPGSAVNGMLRYNTNTNKFEGYENGTWVNVVGGGSPSGSNGDIQFKNGTSFSGSSNLNFSSNILTLAGSIDLNDTGGGLIGLSRNDLTTTADELLGQIAFGSEDAGYNNAHIGVYASQAHSPTTSGTYLTLATVPNNATGSLERMRVDQAGNVGIGTSPAANTKLDVSGQIRSGYYANSNLSIDWSRGNIQTTSGAAGTINFTSNTMYDGASYVLVVTSTGTYTLGVAGDVTTWRCLPACTGGSNNQFAATGHTILTILKVGTTGYVSWSAGY